MADSGETIISLCPNPALDKSTHIDHVVPDEKLRCGPPRVDPGGGGVNVARAIRRIDGDCLLIYLAGGPTGDLIEVLLEEEGVPEQRLAVEAITRESFTVFEDATGHQYRFSTPGGEVMKKEWQDFLDTVFNRDALPQYLVGSGSISPGMPDDFYAQIARRCRENDIRFIIDSSGEEFRQAIDAGVFLVKPNMRELGHLAGEEIRDEEHQIEVSQGLVDAGKAQVVIVSLGAGGAFLVTKERQEHIRAPTVNIRSKIGAGDTMVGGITLALARGRSVREAAYFGVAAGSAAVTTPGTELAHKDDIERLFDRMWSRVSS